MNIELKKLKNIINKKYDISKFKNVYIIGSGKSLKNINFKKINYNENFIITVNYSLFYENIKSNLLFSIDPTFIQRIYYNLKHRFNQDKLNDENLIRVIFPNDFSNYNEGGRKKPNNLLIINHESNFEINSLEELKYRVPKNDLSGNKAIYLAIYLGFKNIILCGLDTINPNIEYPEIKNKKSLHFDKFHQDKKNYNDLIKRNESNNSNIKKFFKLIDEQKKNDNQKINITFL